MASAGDFNCTGLAVDTDCALVRLVQPVEDFHQRAFARAILAEQRVNLARLDVEVNAVVGDQRAEAFGDAAHLKQGHRAYS